MRFIIYGVGAIGGTIAAALTLAGREVAGIARGKMLDAIQANGLVSTGCSSPAMPAPKRSPSSPMM